MSLNLEVLTKDCTNFVSERQLYDERQKRLCGLFFKDGVKKKGLTIKLLGIPIPITEDSIVPAPLTKEEIKKILSSNELIPSGDVEKEVDLVLRASYDKMKEPSYQLTFNKKANGSGQEIYFPIIHVGFSE